MKRWGFAICLVALAAVVLVAAAPAYAQVSRELIRNGDFTGVTEWSFKGECAIWRSNSDQTNEWVEVLVPRCSGNIQLAQQDLALKADTAYRLEFTGTSSAGHDLAVLVTTQQAPNEGLGLDAVCDFQSAAAEQPISWESCAVDFKMPEAQQLRTQAQLRFWLTPFARADDLYRIDNVSLMEVGEPVDLNQCTCR